MSRLFGGENSKRETVKCFVFFCFPCPFTSPYLQTCRRTNWWHFCLLMKFFLERKRKWKASFSDIFITQPVWFLFKCVFFSFFFYYYKSTLINKNIVLLLLIFYFIFIFFNGMRAKENFRNFSSLLELKLKNTVAIGKTENLLP